MLKSGPAVRSARWLKVAVTAAALPLMAPTCTGSGLHQFSASSLIIPMDECYQTDKVADEQSYCVAPNATGDDGVLKAYGLVYFLIKHGIAVYWVIDPTKASVTDVDLTLVGTGEPALKYSWASNTFSSFLGGATQITYRGGPFVIDGEDAATVQSLLTTNPDFAQFLSAATVDIHQSVSAFTAPVAKTLAGVPPTLGLLDIRGGDSVNSEAVLEGYLQAAGLDFTGAGGNAAPLPDGGAEHGIIYDRLFAPDLIANGSGQSVLSENGYGLLWIPHWEGPGSTLYPDAGLFYSDGGSLIPILQSIGGFVDDGGNLFVECAGIGTVEGTFYVDGGVNSGFGPGTPQSRSDTDAGVEINSPSSPIPPPYTFGIPASPFSQIGDFPFSSVSGAINDFAAVPNTSFLPEVQQLIVESDAYSLFTVVPHRHDDNAGGAVVYLGGHTYVGQTAGTRLVLNTLFNLSATCISPNSPCNTGLLGPCAAGILQCNYAGALVCNELPDAGPTPEICDGIDNNCDGLVDNLPPRACYDGPAGTDQFPPCQDGTQSCVDAMWGPCEGETLPQPVSCNGIDDACNGLIDVLPDGGALVQACYTGPLGTEGVGVCHGGTQTCDTATSAYGPCEGEQTPGAPICSTTIDNNCDGVPDTSACQCQNGQTQSCYDGPPGTVNVGICHAGQQTCADNQWGPCDGEQTPEPEVCDGSGIDYNCSGIPQDGCGQCTDGDTQPCWTGPDGGLRPDGGGVGVCHAGAEVCANQLWGTCEGEVLPGIELCDGLDNNCNGQVDENAICPSGQTCVNGVCAPSSCSTEIDECGEGFSCSGTACVPADCGTLGSPCPTGEKCESGACVDPCQGVVCGAGSFCSAGTCVAGGCYDTGCPSGQACQGGQCVTDPCASLTCPVGDFCRDGFCVASCVFANCRADQICDADGQCESPPCGGTCGSGVCLGDGGCGPDVCAGVGCAELQECVDQSGVAVCVPTPCADVVCPVGVCVDGQCQRPSTASSGGASGTTGTQGSTGASGSSGSHGSTGASGSMGSHASTTGGGASGGTGSGAGTSGSSSSRGAASGCGCGATGSPASLWMIGVVALLLRRRARSIVLAGAVAVGGCTSGGGSSSTGGSGASTAAATSSGGSTGSHPSASGTSGGSSTHPASTSGTSGSSGIVCPNGQSYCDLDGCVDLLTSLAHCGACHNPCSQGEVCDVGFCGPSGPVNPVATLLDPTSSNIVPAVDVAVVGSMFQNGALVVLNGGGAINTVFPATFISAQQVVGHLDLSGLQPGPATLAVVNPGEILSNTLPFTIGNGTNAPDLTSVSPTSADSNANVTLLITGSQFDSTTVVHISGPGVPDDALTTVLEPDGGLTAQLATTHFLAGPYDLYAVSSDSPRSTPLLFSINSLVPTLTLITPATAVVGSVSGLSAQGTGFDSSTVLHLQLQAWIDGGALADAGTLSDGGVTRIDGGASALDAGPGLATADGGDAGLDLALTTEFISDTEVELPTTSPLNLSGFVPGAYQIVAENQEGTKRSNPLPFPISSARPSLSSLSPASGTQGQGVRLNVMGTGFDPTSVVRYLTDAGTTGLPTQVDDGGYVWADLSLVGMSAGQLGIVVTNSGDLTSNVLPFAVLSNVAVLTGLSPSGGTAGTRVTLALSGSNFESGAQVAFTGAGTPDGGTAVLPSAVNSATSIAVTGLDLTPFQPGAYTVVVTNPGAAASAPLQFSVVPGVPTITSISPASAATNTVQTFTLSGTLFDSSAYVQVQGAGGLSTTLPSTYVDADTLSLPDVNLSNIPPGSYSVTVINPGPHTSTPATLDVTP